MSIKVLGGLLKNRPLSVPKGEQTRPTSVLLKRRLFDSYQNLSDFNFIDVCAGSGGVGVEAWSRGAKSLTLVENHSNALRALHKNVEDIKSFLPEEVSLRPISIKKQSAEACLKELDLRSDTIVFLDPPYEKIVLLEKLLNQILMTCNVEALWLESDIQKGLTVDYWESKGWVPKKVFKQGTSYIAVFFQS